MVRSWLVFLTLLVLACPASALELTPTREVFGPTEDIEVVAFNDTPKTLSFGSSAPFLARNLDTGEVVTFIGLTVMLPLEPGERMSFHILGGELRAGPWALEFRYWDGDFVHCCQTVEFTIAAAGGTPAESVPVTSLKTRYRSR